MATPMNQRVCGTPCRTCGANTPSAPPNYNGPSLVTICLWCNHNPWESPINSFVPPVHIPGLTTSDAVISRAPSQQPGILSARPTVVPGTQVARPKGKQSAEATAHRTAAIKRDAVPTRGMSSFNQNAADKLTAPRLPMNTQLYISEHWEDVPGEAVEACGHNVSYNRMETVGPGGDHETWNAFCTAVVKKIRNFDRFLEDRELMQDLDRDLCIMWKPNNNKGTTPTQIWPEDDWSTVGEYLDPTRFKIQTTVYIFVPVMPGNYVAKVPATVPTIKQEKSSLRVESPEVEIKQEKESVPFRRVNDQPQRKVPVISLLESSPPPSSQPRNIGKHGRPIAAVQRKDLGRANAQTPTPSVKQTPSKKDAGLFVTPDPELPDISELSNPVPTTSIEDVDGSNQDDGASNQQEEEQKEPAANPKKRKAPQKKAKGPRAGQFGSQERSMGTRSTSGPAAKRQRKK